MAAESEVLADRRRHLDVHWVGNWKVVSKMKRLLSWIFRRRAPLATLTPIQQVFAQSHANGLNNRQDLLAANPWRWPSDTWLDRRRKEVRRA